MLLAIDTSSLVLSCALAEKTGSSQNGRCRKD